MARDRSNYQRGGKGGSRQGAPGKNYPNRTDMQTNRQPTQPVRTATNQPYGVAGQQAALQQAVPLPQGPPIIPIDAPTQRPSEPLTAGMPSGAGPGPEVLPQPLFPDADMRAQIASLYRAFPNQDLERLLAYMDARRPPMIQPPPGAAPPPPPTSPTTGVPARPMPAPPQSQGTSMAPTAAPTPEATPQPNA